MTAALLWIGCAVAGAGVSARATVHLAAAGHLHRRNHRGLEIPTAVGVAVLLGVLAGLGLVAALRFLARGSERLPEAAGAGVLVASAAFGFGLLGLWDDLAGRGEERGWRAHVAALRTGRASAGAIKLSGGLLLALVVVAPIESSRWWTVLDAAIVALSANLFNLLDVRPGRASKVFGVAVVGLLIAGGAMAPALAAAGGAMLGYVRFDLRERAMLGDTGANALGAIVGIATVFNASHWPRGATLALLVLLHLVGDRPGLSRLIERVPPLHRLDEAGRVPDQPSSWS